MNVSDLPTRLATKIETDPETGCWLWCAATDGPGYGAVRWAGRVAAAHRVAYHLLVDQTFPVSPGGAHVGLQLDHLCETRRCVNPEHLEPVTHAENRHRFSVRFALRRESKRAEAAA